MKHTCDEEEDLGPRRHRLDSSAVTGNLFTSDFAIFNRTRYLTVLSNGDEAGADTPSCSVEVSFSFQVPS